MTPSLLPINKTLKRLKQVSLNKATLYLLLVSWVEESLKHHHWLYGRLSRTHYPDIFMTTCSRYCRLSIFTSWWDIILRLPCRGQNSRREKLGYEHLAERNAINAIIGVWVKYVIERPRSSGPSAGRFVRSHCGCGEKHVQKCYGVYRERSIRQKGNLCYFLYLYHSIALTTAKLWPNCKEFAANQINDFSVFLYRHAALK